jgi:hypothetical protein
MACISQTASTLFSEIASSAMPVEEMDDFKEQLNNQ